MDFGSGIGLVSALSFSILMQLSRQISYNAGLYLWKSYLFPALVPDQYKNVEWFSDKSSFFYINKDEFKFKTLGVLNQNNARTFVIYFGLIYWMFSTQPLSDIQEASTVILSAFTSSSIAVAVIMFVCRLTLRNTNPDIFVTVFLHGASVVFSFFVALFLVS